MFQTTNQIDIYIYMLFIYIYIYILFIYIHLYIYIPWSSMIHQKHGPHGLDPKFAKTASTASARAVHPAVSSWWWPLLRVAPWHHFQAPREIAPAQWPRFQPSQVLQVLHAQPSESTWCRAELLWDPYFDMSTKCHEAPSKPLASHAKPASLQKFPLHHLSWTARPEVRKRQAKPPRVDLLGMSPRWSPQRPFVAWTVPGRGNAELVQPFPRSTPARFSWNLSPSYRKTGKLCIRYWGCRSAAFGFVHLTTTAWMMKFFENKWNGSID